MIILRSRLFSEDKKKNKKKSLKEIEQRRDRVGLGQVVGGIALAGLGGKAMNKVSSKYTDKVLSDDYNNSQDSLDTKQLLARNAFKGGVEFRRRAGVKIPFLDIDTTKLDVDKEGKVLVGKNHHKLHEVAEAIAAAENLRPNGKGDKFGKIINKINKKGGAEAVSNFMKSDAGRQISFINGLKAGHKKERLKSEGKKVGAFTKFRPVGLPALAVAPSLIANATNLAKGYGLVKNSGASNETLEKTKRQMIAKFGKDLVDSSKPVLAGAAGNLVGRGIGKWKFDSPEVAKRKKRTRKKK